VHQMRTDLAQYYQSKKPSLRLQYITTNDEKVNFEINGTDLLLRDLNIFCTTKANHRAIVEQMKQLVINNNTTGASIFDLGNIMQSDSLAELNHVLKASEKKAIESRQEEGQTAERMKQMEIEARIKEKQMQLDHEDTRDELNRRRDILVAEIRAAGMAGAVDLDKNQQSDYLDILEKIKGSQEFAQNIDLQKSKEGSKTEQDQAKNEIEREKIAAQIQMKGMDVQIAKENKNKFDKKAADSKKKK
jgi:hypothetical protein